MADFLSIFNSFSTNRAGFISKVAKEGLGDDEEVSGKIFDALKKAKGGAEKTTKESPRSNEPFSIIGTVRKILESQENRNLESSYSGEITKLSDILDGVFNKSTNSFVGFKGVLENLLNTTVDQITTAFQQQADLQEKINENTGMTGRLSEDFRTSITESLPYAMRLGLTFEKISDMVANTVTQSGRFKLLGTETINQMSLMSRVAFDNTEKAAESLESFQKVSRGASDAMKVVEKASLGSLQLGLNAKETTRTLVSNIDKLNSYGFQNGVEGLTKMVQKAQALRLDLNEAFKLATKVMDPTDALSLSANLQAIGGALGAFNDPIRMMWMATNNVEGLQDALAESAESLVTFNKNSGVFEVVGANLRRAKGMADELGMSMQDLTNLAVQSAQRTAASADLMSRGLIFENDDDKEFLTNLAQMKGGRMVIEVPENLKAKFGEADIALETMSEFQKNQILEYRKQFKEMSSRDIAEQQVNSIRNIERNINFITARMRVEAGKQGENLAKAIGYDPMQAITETREFADKLDAGLIDLSGSVGDLLKQFIPEEKRKWQGETPKNGTVSGNITHTHTFTGSDIFNPVMRKLMEDPTIRQLYEDTERAFLNSQPVKTN